MAKLLHISTVLLTIIFLTYVLLTLLHDALNVSFTFSTSGEIKSSSKLVYRSLETQINVSNTNVSTDPRTVYSDQCGIAVENRIDCARDRSLSRADCENRGCCYEPLSKSGFSGPPWCFYPVRYPGYKMGVLTPTERGQRATLTRSTPSYLPRDISTLQLDVIAESSGCLHLTVSESLLSNTCYHMTYVFLISQ